MFEERFIQLVEENGGFEYYQAYRNDVDHILGGKGDTYWYVIMKKGKVTESYMGKYKDGVWEDVYVKGSGASKKTKAMPSGNTIKRIAEKAYLCQNETWSRGERRNRLRMHIRVTIMCTTSATRGSISLCSTA